MEIKHIADWVEVRDGLHRANLDLVLNRLWKNHKAELTAQGVTLDGGNLWWRPKRPIAPIRPVTPKPAPLGHPAPQNACKSHIAPPIPPQKVGLTRFTGHLQEITLKQSELIAFGERQKRGELEMFDMEVLRHGEGYVVTYRFLPEKELT